MLVRHLVVGVVAGGLAALGSGLMAFSAWAIIGFYVLGGNLGSASACWPVWCPGPYGA